MGSSLSWLSVFPEEHEVCYPTHPACFFRTQREPPEWAAECMLFCGRGVCVSNIAVSSTRYAMSGADIGDLHLVCLHQYVCILGVRYAVSMLERDVRC